jgi:hypothetical protein
MGVMRCVGGGHLGLISFPLAFVVFLSDIFRVYRYLEVAWPARYCSIASINRHVRHREAPACKRVKARLPAGTAMYSTVATIFTSYWPQQRPQRGRMRCFLRIHCQSNNEDDPNVSYKLPAKLGIICNARPFFVGFWMYLLLPYQFPTTPKEFGGVVWKLETRPSLPHIGPGLPSSYHIFR